ncbi:Uncharacterised protein [Mycobacteroides abscessus subsp. abscessus]|nr:Uncharacterised protein [Mycobacteroides abscessus subsp. abscessus]
MLKALTLMPLNTWAKNTMLLTTNTTVWLLVPVVQV